MYFTCIKRVVRLKKKKICLAVKRTALLTGGWGFQIISNYGSGAVQGALRSKYCIDSITTQCTLYVLLSNTILYCSYNLHGA